jgi:Ca-activated chloride channel homolog
MSFEAPLWFLLLALAPLLLMTRRAGGVRIAHTAHTSGIQRSWRTRLSPLPTAMRMTALALCVVALAGPRLSPGPLPEWTEGVDVMIALDVSRSMTAADIPPSRFDVAQTTARQFGSQLTARGDRVGLVAFAGRAHVFSPPTLDGAFVSDRVSLLEPGMLEDGTAIGMAIVRSLQRLAGDHGEGGAIVLLSDGVNNRGEIDPYTAAEMAAAVGVRIHSIGFSSQDDQELDEALLRDIAGISGGAYFRSADEQSLRRAYDDIAALERTARVERSEPAPRPLHMPVIAAAIAVLLLGTVASSTLLFRFP